MHEYPKTYGIGRSRRGLGQWFWAAYVRRRGRLHYRRFYDAKYGGSDEARRAAIAWRDVTLANVQVLTVREFNQRTRSNSRSGVPGVHFRKNDRQPIGAWRATLKLPNGGKRLSETFSIKKLGDREAFRQAVAARERMLSLVSRAAYVKDAVAKEFALRHLHADLEMGSTRVVEVSSMYRRKRQKPPQEAICRANDLDYARELFTDLVVAATSKSSVPPDPLESQAIADMSLKMANVFRVALERSGFEPRELPRQTRSVAGPAKTLGTFEDAAKQWMVRISERTTGENSQKIFSRLERFVIPYLGTRPLPEITPQELLKVLRSPDITRFACLQYQLLLDVRNLYHFALVAGLSDQDPTYCLGAAVVKPPRQRATDAVLDDACLGRLLVAIRQYRGKSASSARHLFRLAPMLFLRSRELRLLEWRDVDLDAATIVIPAERMKNRLPHLVPLARQAVRFLRDLQSRTGHCRYVFPSTVKVDQPLVRHALNQMLQAVGYGKAFTPHAFRAIACTWMNEEGWREDAIERQLSHIGSDGTRRSYNRAEYISERRKMMQAWADHLDALEYKARAIAEVA